MSHPSGHTAGAGAGLSNQWCPGALSEWGISPHGYLTGEDALTPKGDTHAAVTGYGAREGRLSHRVLMARPCHGCLYLCSGWPLETGDNDPLDKEGCGGMAREDPVSSAPPLPTCHPPPTPEVRARGQGCLPPLSLSLVTTGPGRSQVINSRDRQTEGGVSGRGGDVSLLWDRNIFHSVTGRPRIFKQTTE